MMKIYDTKKFASQENPAPAEQYRLDILTEAEGAIKLGGHFSVQVAGGGGAYHYHENRESLLFIIRGEGIEVVEGKEYPVKAGDVLFIPAREKHTILNRSDEELRYLEFYTPPQRDVVEVK